MYKIGILGAGSWGTALGILLCENGHDVRVWSYKKEEVKLLNETRIHQTKLPGIILPEALRFTEDIKEAVLNMDVVVMAVPSSVVRKTAKNICGYVREGQILVDVSKGIEEKTLMTLSQQIESEIPAADVAVISGPSHAEEVAKRLPTAVVVGAKTKETALFLQNIFMNEYFRVYISPDMLGIELGGALKNVIALAAGTADGLGYGDNTKAALITRGMAEITRLGKKMGGREETFAGLTGMGDLVVTCASVHSRNRKAGYLIGKGKTMEEAMKEVNMVVEGVYSAKATLKLGQLHQVSMPIVEAVNQVLFAGENPKEAVERLMVRKGKEETIFFR